MQNTAEAAREMPSTSLDPVIPAVPGEFYAYSAQFTAHRPLYVFMKCKANKDRLLTDAGALGREANLVFLFGDSVQVCSTMTAHRFGRLGTIEGRPFGETRIAPAPISVERFYEICSGKDARGLVEFARTACLKPRVHLEILPGTLTAAMTDDGKYAFFLATEVGPDSVRIQACHILLP